MSEKSLYNELLKKYLEGTINPEEQEKLFKIGATFNMDELLAEQMEADWMTDLQVEDDLPVDISEKIVHTILTSEENTNRLFIKPGWNILYQKLAIAATFLIFVLGSLFFYNDSTKSVSKITFESFVPENNLKKINYSNGTQQIALEDGSIIQLKPNSSLSYPAHFSSDKRVVYLTGEAFFVISKNPNKPFLVYYDDIITRVLGTSFSIKTNPKTKNVEVSVKTGRVQVSENILMTSAMTADEKPKSVILVPNQKAMFNIVHREFETTLADTIHSLALSDTEKYIRNKGGLHSFVFEKPTGLKQIFSLLESVYGIEIVVENENIYNCVFTGDISSQEMLRKLNIVCLTIGASYEVKGTKILVSGKGCQ